MRNRVAHTDEPGIPKRAMRHPRKSLSIVAILSVLATVIVWLATAHAGFWLIVREKVVEFGTPVVAVVIALIVILLMIVLARTLGYPGPLDPVSFVEGLIF